MRALSLILALMVPVFCVEDVDWNSNWQRGANWAGASGAASQGSLQAGRSKFGNSGAIWGLQDDYAAKDSRQGGKVGASGIRDRASAAVGANLRKSIVSHDKGYSDTGYRNVQGKVEYGRNSAFHDSARDAAIATSSGSSKSHLVDADRAGYAQAAQAGRVAGGVRQVGNLRKNAASNAGIAAAEKESVGRTGWGALQLGKWNQALKPIDFS